MSFPILKDFFLTSSTLKMEVSTFLQGVAMSLSYCRRHLPVDCSLRRFCVPCRLLLDGLLGTKAYILVLHLAYVVSGTCSGILQPNVRCQNKVGIRICKYTKPCFANSWRRPKNKIYVTRALQWVGASKFFDNSNGSSCHTARCWS
jgi:hypothetical protein